MNTDVSAMLPNGDRNDDTRKGVRRTALWMSLLAFAIYAAFIISSVLRAQ